MRVVVLLLAPLGHMGLLPAPMRLAVLYVAREQMDSLHPDLPELAVEIAALERPHRA